MIHYYGEPSEKDIRNANFTLHLPEQGENDGPLLDSEAIKSALVKFADHEGYQYQLQIDDNMIAKTLVSRTTVKINSIAKVSKIETMALAHHELGVHLATTLKLGKLMQVMLERDQSKPLSGFIELDDAYLGGERSGKPGRGSENKWLTLF